MKAFIALLASLALSGCGKSYPDLESAFGVETIPDGTKLSAKTIVLTSQNHPGAERYGELATIQLSRDSIGIELSLPFTKPISIPTDQVAGCSMTCFGTNDQHVDLLIPKTGIDIMIASSTQLLDWCWSAKRPMIPASITRAWQYHGTPLPPTSNFKEQFLSRDLFDEQKRQSCLGY